MTETTSRVVLITGGSKGIGLASARHFAALGDRVAVTYNSSPPASEFFAVKCDAVAKGGEMACTRETNAFRSTGDEYDS